MVDIHTLNYQMEYFTVLEDLTDGAPNGRLTKVSFSNDSDFFSWYARNQEFHKVHYQGYSYQEARRVWRELDARRLKEKELPQQSVTLESRL